MNSSQRVWQQSKNKSGNIFSKITQDGFQQRRRLYKVHKHILLNIDIICTNKLIQMQISQQLNDIIPHAQEMYRKIPR